MAARGRACGTCDYAAAARAGGMDVLHCHRFPPAPDLRSVADLAEHDPRDPLDPVSHVELSVDPIDMDRWPTVAPSDWCGDWKATPPVALDQGVAR